MKKLIYTNEFGGSLEFSSTSQINVTEFSGLTSNSISLSESKVLNGVGTANTGLNIESKQLTVAGRFKANKNIRKRMLDIIVPGIKAKLRYIDDEYDTDVFWDVQPSSTPDISWDVNNQDFQFTVKAFFPYPKSNTLYSCSFIKQEANVLLPMDFTTDGFVIGTNVLIDELQIDNDGLEAGILLKIKPVLLPLDRIDFWDSSTGNQALVTISGLSDVVEAGDIVELSTEPNNIYCHLVKSDGSVKNIITNLNITTGTLPKLKRGSNFFKMRVNNDLTKRIHADVRVEFRKVYAGV